MLLALRRESYFDEARSSLRNTCKGNKYSFKPGFSLANFCMVIYNLKMLIHNQIMPKPKSCDREHKCYFSRLLG